MPPVFTEWSDGRTDDKAHGYAALIDKKLYGMNSTEQSETDKTGRPAELPGFVLNLYSPL